MDPFRQAAASAATSQKPGPTGQAKIATDTHRAAAAAAATPAAPAGNTGYLRPMRALSAKEAIAKSVFQPSVLQPQRRTFTAAAQFHMKQQQQQQQQQQQRPSTAGDIDSQPMSNRLNMVNPSASHHLPPLSATVPAVGSKTPAYTTTARDGALVPATDALATRAARGKQAWAALAKREATNHAWPHAVKPSLLGYWSVSLVRRHAPATGRPGREELVGIVKVQCPDSLPEVTAVATAVRTQSRAPTAERKAAIPTVNPAVVSVTPTTRHIALADAQQQQPQLAQQGKLSVLATPSAPSATAAASAKPAWAVTVAATNRTSTVKSVPPKMPDYSTVVAAITAEVERLGLAVADILYLDEEFDNTFALLTHKTMPFCKHGIFRVMVTEKRNEDAERAIAAAKDKLLTEQQQQQCEGSTQGEASALQTDINAALRQLEAEFEKNHAATDHRDGDDGYETIMKLLHPSTAAEPSARALALVQPNKTPQPDVFLSRQSEEQAGAGKELFLTRSDIKWQASEQFRQHLQQVRRLMTQETVVRDAIGQEERLGRIFLTQFERADREQTEVNTRRAITATEQALAERAKQERVCTLITEVRSHTRAMELEKTRKMPEIVAVPESLNDLRSAFLAAAEEEALFRAQHPVHENLMMESSHVSTEVSRPLRTERLLAEEAHTCLREVVPVVPRMEETEEDEEATVLEDQSSHEDVVAESVDGPGDREAAASTSRVVYSDDDEDPHNHSYALTSLDITLRPEHWHLFDMDFSPLFTAMRADVATCLGLPFRSVVVAAEAPRKEHAPLVNDHTESSLTDEAHEDLVASVPSEAVTGISPRDTTDTRACKDAAAANVDGVVSSEYTEEVGEDGDSCVVHLLVEHDGARADDELQALIASYDFPCLTQLCEDYAEEGERSSRGRREQTPSVTPSQPMEAEEALAHVPTATEEQPEQDSLHESPVHEQGPEKEEDGSAIDLVEKDKEELPRVAPVMVAGEEEPSRAPSLVPTEESDAFTASRPVSGASGRLPTTEQMTTVEVVLGRDSVTPLPTEHSTVLEAVDAAAAAAAAVAAEEEEGPREPQPEPEWYLEYLAMKQRGNVGLQLEEAASMPYEAHIEEMQKEPVVVTEEPAENKEADAAAAAAVMSSEDPSALVLGDGAALDEAQLRELCGCDDVAVTHHDRVLEGDEWHLVHQSHRDYMKQQFILDLAAGLECDPRCVRNVFVIRGGSEVVFDLAHNADIEKDQLDRFIKEYPFPLLAALYECREFLAEEEEPHRALSRSTGTLSTPTREAETDTAVGITGEACDEVPEANPASEHPAHATDAAAVAEEGNGSASETHPDAPLPLSEDAEDASHPREEEGISETAEATAAPQPLTEEVDEIPVDEPVQEGNDSTSAREENVAREQDDEDFEELGDPSTLDERVFVAPVSGDGLRDAGSSERPHSDGEVASSQASSVNRALDDGFGSGEFEEIREAPQDGEALSPPHHADSGAGTAGGLADPEGDDTRSEDFEELVPRIPMREEAPAADLTAAADVTHAPENGASLALPSHEAGSGVYDDDDDDVDSRDERARQLVADLFSEAHVCSSHGTASVSGLPPNLRTDSASSCPVDSRRPTANEITQDFEELLAPSPDMASSGARPETAPTGQTTPTPARVIPTWQTPSVARPPTPEPEYTKARRFPDFNCNRLSLAPSVELVELCGLEEGAAPVLSHHHVWLPGSEWGLILDSCPLFLRDQFTSETCELLGCAARCIRNVLLRASDESLRIDFDLIHAGEWSYDALDTALRGHVFHLLMELYRSRNHVAMLNLDEGLEANRPLSAPDTASEDPHAAPPTARTSLPNGKCPRPPSRDGAPQQSSTASSARTSISSSTRRFPRPTSTHTNYERMSLSSTRATSASAAPTVPMPSAALPNTEPVSSPTAAAPVSVSEQRTPSRSPAGASVSACSGYDYRHEVHHTPLAPLVPGHARAASASSASGMPLPPPAPTLSSPSPVAQRGASAQPPSSGNITSSNSHPTSGRSTASIHTVVTTPLARVTASDAPTTASPQPPSHAGHVSPSGGQRSGPVVSYSENVANVPAAAMHGVQRSPEMRPDQGCPLMSGSSGEDGTSMMAAMPAAADRALRSPSRRAEMESSTTSTNVAMMYSESSLLPRLDPRAVRRPSNPVYQHLNSSRASSTRKRGLPEAGASAADTLKWEEKQEECDDGYAAAQVAEPAARVSVAHSVPSSSHVSHSRRSSANIEEVQGYPPLQSHSAQGVFHPQ